MLLVDGLPKVVKVPLERLLGPRTGGRVGLVLGRGVGGYRRCRGALAFPRAAGCEVGIRTRVVRAVGGCRGGRVDGDTRITPTGAAL